MSPVRWISRSSTQARLDVLLRRRGAQRVMQVAQPLEHPRLAAAVGDVGERREPRVALARHRPRAPAARTRTAPCDPGSSSARTADRGCWPRPGTSRTARSSASRMKSVSASVRPGTFSSSLPHARQPLERRPASARCRAAPRTRPTSGSATAPRRARRAAPARARGASARRAPPAASSASRPRARRTSMRLTFSSLVSSGSAAQRQRQEGVGRDLAVEHRVPQRDPRAAPRQLVVDGRQVRRQPRAGWRGRDGSRRRRCRRRWAGRTRRAARAPPAPRRARAFSCTGTSLTSAAPPTATLIRWFHVRPRARDTDRAA